MVLTGALPLSAAHEEGGGADRLGLSRRDQHAAGQAGAFGLVDGAISKDVVSRAWRKVKTDWEVWCARGLAEEDILPADPGRRVVKAQNQPEGDWSLVLSGNRRAPGRPEGPVVAQEHGRREHGGVAAFLGDLDARGLKAPDFVIVDGAPGLEAALTEWPDAPVQRCTVHKHPQPARHRVPLHDELTEDYRDMVYAETKAEIADARATFLASGR